MAETIMPQRPEDRRTYSGSNREPSTAFCLLLRLLTLRCTEKQMKLLLDHPDSPYIRAIGFLYLRYAGDPVSIWRWIEPYLYDEEPIQIEANVAKQQETIGDFVRNLFSNRNYHGTMLPRLPIQIEREIQVKLLQAEKVEERAKKHAANRHTMEYFKKLGSKCRALYGDDENPTQWYDAVIDRVITTNEDTLQPLRNPKFVVTFPEYGNTETVLLGEMEMPGVASDEPIKRGGFTDRESSRRGCVHDTRTGDRGYPQSDGKRGHGYRDRGYNNLSRDNRGYDDGRNAYRGRGRDKRRNGDGHRDWDGQTQRRWDRPRGVAEGLPSEDDLYEEVRRRERETVTTSRSRGPPKDRIAPSLPRDVPRSQSHRSSRGYGMPPPPQNSTADVPRKRTGEELRAIQEKKRKLMAKYG
eukprot:scaffold22661_cov200-Cylindrotheca_fusiformis.AAC.3